MKKIYLALILLGPCINLCYAQNDTLYIMKYGEVVERYNVNSEIDSIIFYEPTFNNKMDMADYVQKHEQYTEFERMLEHTGLNSILNSGGPFTLFLPTNNAINELYDDLNVSTFTEISDTGFARNFIYNHIIGTSIVTEEMGIGALPETNLLGDYIASDLDNTDILLNKEAIITQRDIKLSNGYIHEIDKTIPIIEKSIYQTLKDMPAYSLFLEGLKRTGLSDTLALISYELGGFEARNRYTVLAVADTTFNRYGINNYDDLVAYFTDDASKVTYYDNEFYQYMVYHCMQNTYYLSDLTTTAYPDISQENHVLVTTSPDYQLNLDPATGNYTGFNITESNYPTKNGVIHTIDDLLVAKTPKPAYVIWEVTDQLENTSGDWYSKNFHKWFDGENSFEEIKFQGDYLQYYFKDHDTGPLLNDDCLHMHGYWWIEITTPKITKGKYQISGNIWRNMASYRVYVDGKKVGIVNSYDMPDLGTHTWDETKQHTIKLVAAEYGELFWDTVTFTPVD